MSIVAHDLKSPLNKVLGLTQLMPISGTLNAEQEKCIRLINKVVEGGRKLIDDILIINAYEIHAEPLQFIDLNIGTLLQEVVSTFNAQAEKKSIDVHFEAPTPLQVLTDKESLTRILDNLIDNAIKFSPKYTQIHIALSKEEHEAKIVVKDEGPGFSVEDQKKMFKKFQKLSARPTDGESSTGLGLSIIKVLVEKLNGSIEVDTMLGKGTSFSIFLPLPPEA